MAWKKTGEYKSLEELEKATKTIIEKYAIENKLFIHEDKNVLFTLETKYPWGRYKGNELRDVFKIDPGYIDWCINVANGFGVAPHLLPVLLKKGSFIIDQIYPYIEETTDNNIILNLSQFSRDNDGFLFKKEIQEYNYGNTERIINANNSKIERGLSYQDYRYGIPSNQTPFDIIMPFRRNHIEIRVPK